MNDARKVNASYITGEIKFDNYIPCLCNGVITEGLEKKWNPKKWTPKFHIITKDLINAIDIAVYYVIYEEETIVAYGIVIYSVQSGEIDNSKFQCHIIKDKDISINEVKNFMKHIISYFGEMNYIAKINATHRKAKKSSKGKVFGGNLMSSNKEVSYNFQEKEQSTYTPKKKGIKKGKKKKEKTSKPKKSNTNRTVYKRANWERAGYYTRYGTYVPPCTMKRHIHN